MNKLMLVDTHAHLYWDSYKDDLDQVLENCKKNNVKLIINIGTDLETSQQAIDTSKKLRALGFESYATVGLHPHDTQECNNESIQQFITSLENLYLNNKDYVVAIGECGLDYFFRDEFNTKNTAIDDLKVLQKKLFVAQVNLAKKLNLPLVIHCREAWSDIFIPELEGTKGVFHNFSGTIEEIKKSIELCYFISFSCVITYPKNENLRELIKEIPIDTIVSETDCPFLPPQQIRGQRNDPSYINEVVKTIADCKEKSDQEIEDALEKNARKLFSI